MLNALEARHVWLPQGAPAFTVTALPVRGTADGTASILIPALSCLEHILIDARGAQHVVLRGNGATMQLRIEGVDIAAGPVALAFAVQGLGAIPDACRELALVRRILAPAARLRRTPRWTPTTLKLRDALVALDGRAAGASHRDIAVALHGTAYVTANWMGGLKERVRRNLARGVMLSEGGYRALLA
jgi:hypothetical protein